MNAQFSIVGIGEVLWDMLPSGPQMGGGDPNINLRLRYAIDKARCWDSLTSPRRPSSTCETPSRMMVIGVRNS